MPSSPAYPPAGPPRRRRTTALAVSAACCVAAALSAGPGAQAVNTPHGDLVVSADPADFTPHAMDGSVDAIVQVGDMVVAAGTFTSVSPAGTFWDTTDDLERRHLVAFDAETGEIDTGFDPVLGGPVDSLDTDGTSVYVAGSFRSVGGDRRFQRVVKLTSSGAVDTSFRARPDGRVSDVVVRGDRVYIGGTFTSITREDDVTDRFRLAALNATTGAVIRKVDVAFEGVYDRAIGGVTMVKRFDVSANGRKLVAVGNFRRVDGQRRVQVAVIRTGVGGARRARVATWATSRFDAASNDCSPRFGTFARDVDLSPDGSYFVITTTAGFAGGATLRPATLCDTVSRWEVADAESVKPTWINYTGGDTTYGVAITGDVVYVGGHFRWLNNPFQGNQAGPGAVPRSGLAALDAVNGLPLSWDPGRTRGVGAQALHATSEGLWIGSDTTWTGGERRGRIAFMPLAGGTQLPSVAQTSLPGTLYMAGGSAGTSLLRRPLNGSGVPTAPAEAVNTAVDWSSIRGAFYLDGELYHGLADGHLVVRSFDPATGAAGEPHAVELYDDPDDGARIPFAISGLTGMFYDPASHRLYYTVAGDSRLRYRYFTPESRVVGARTFKAAKPRALSFASVAGLTMASGRIVYGSWDGALRTLPFSGGRVSGTPTVVSTDGTWAHRALFMTGAAPEHVLPVRDERP